MNVTWGIIRSWHALPPTRALVATKALCGRNVPEGERFEGAIRFVVTGRTWAWVS